MSCIARLSIVLSLAIVSTVSAQGQRPGWGNWGRPPANQQPRPVTVSGKLEETASGALLIKDESTPCVIVLQQQTKLGITGTAKADFLKAGQLVTFTADVDKKGVVADPVKELRITVVSDTTRPGLFNEDRDNKESTKFYVCGTVRTFKEGKLTLSAGGKPVTATVADDATIKYEGLDLTVLKPGDTVTVEGQQWRAFNGATTPPTPQVVGGEKVDITLNEPLSAASKKKPPVTRKT